jgi:sugar/nucleoside kinase (ribokinase family)
MFDVTIAGDINLDLILYGLQEEIPVERESLASDFRLTLGGSGSITAHNLASLGCKVGLVGKIGGDELGEISLARLRDAGVDTSHCIHSSTGAVTGVTIVLPHGRTRRILTYPGTIAEMSVQDIDVEYLARSKHFHISSFFLQKNLQKGLPELCHQLRAQGLTVSMDSNDDPEDRWGEAFLAMLPAIDILLPNEDEAKRMTGKSSLNEALAYLSKKVPVIVVKCGSRGAILQTAERCVEVPSLAVTPIDTIGAGDSFNAGFLSRFVKGDSLESCVALGNIAAALSTQRPGGTESFRDTAFAQSFLSQHMSPDPQRS